MSSQPNADGLPYLSQANTLGQGFDVYGVYGAESLLRPIFDLDIVPTSVFTFLGKDYEIPSIVNGIQNTSSVYNAGTFVSREGFQAKIAAFAGVDGKYGAFSGQLRASYSTDYTRSTEYYYAFKNFYARLGQLQLKADSLFLTAEFSHAVSQLPNTISQQSLPAFADFFARFGAYYTSQVSLGASMEFYNGVYKATSDTSDQIAAMFEAHFTGLFASGNISSGITSSKEWKSYLENSTLSIATTGGDAVSAAHLQSIDTRSPSEVTVNAYDAWLETISANPAVSEYKLSGIWNVCGEKKTLVQQAWQLYGTSMHPRLTIETANPAAQPPTITLGYQIKPAGRPARLSGWQVAILDRRDVSSASKVVFDRYYTFEEQWPLSFQSVYQTMAHEIRESEFADGEHILLACAFGVPYNCCPGSDFYSLLRSAGAGQQLQRWVMGADPGSGNKVQACYAMIGVFNEGADTGLEDFRYSYDQNLNINLDAYFYRVAYGLPYTLGLAALPSGARMAGTEPAAVRQPARV
jgi:hypothetical protein